MTLLPSNPYTTNQSRDKMKKPKQQQQLLSFFKKKEKEKGITQEEEPKESENIAAANNIAADKENTITINVPSLSTFMGTMGCKSQDRKSAIQRAKQHTYCIQQALRDARAKGIKIKTNNPQRKLDGSVAEPRCDDPDNPKECNACTKKALYEARGKKFKGFAHHYSCPHNKDYFDNLMTGPKSESTKEFEAEAKRIAKVNNQPLPGPDLHVTKEDGVKFFSPRNSVPPPPPDAETAPKKNPPPPPETAPDPLAPDPFDVTYMTKKIRHFMQNPTASMKRGKTVPNIIGAAIETLLEISPRKFKRGTNTMLGREGTDTASRYDIYKKYFRPGTLGFTFPRADVTKQPDTYYSQLEGITIYLVSWETNVPGIMLRCHRCDGEMIHKNYDWLSHGYATPLFDLSGRTDWAASMTYQCNSCMFKCKANAGIMLATIKPEIRMSYPVDARYATGETHMTLATTRIIDDLMVTHGNGDQISRMLHRMRGMCYEDLQERYYSACITTGTAVDATRTLPTFEKWLALYGPSGQVIRDAKDAAFKSELNSICISDKERFDREVQGVGATLAVASDATFEATKSYMKGNIDGAGIMHTLNQEDGQLASVVLVPSLEQRDAAHQIEQFSLRPNVSPKAHYSDTCPSGISLWKALFGNSIVCRLGLFHFQQRIVKTLNKECRLGQEAIAALQECVYWYDKGDLEKVMKCMGDGTLGVRNKQKVPENQRLSKAKLYRKHVRIYTYDAETIRRNLKAWVTTFATKKDTIGVPLFTIDTEKTVQNQINKAEWVVDVLGKDTLYYPITAGVMSKTGLPTWIGMRGVESKLEKIHHLLAHFANTGMRTTLADALIMAGVALYNLSIRHRLRINNLSPMDRSLIPVAFHRCPAFTNHLRLQYINRLARNAGATTDVFFAVEETIQNNGEKFLSSYLVEQKTRRLDAPDPKTNRCMCVLCGSHPEANNRISKLYVQQKRPAPAPAPTTQAEPVVSPPLPAPQPVVQQVMRPFAVAANPSNMVAIQPSLTISMPPIYPYPQMTYGYGYVPIVTSNQGSYSEIMKRARLE